ncbi:hypothetical protein NBRC10513_000253 [Rhodotorula toruloides]
MGPDADPAEQSAANGQTHAHLTLLLNRTDTSCGTANDGAPPAYSPPPHANGSSSQPNQQQQVALVDFAEYHVYKDGRMWGKDDIITGPDKQVMLYYLHFPVKFFSARWDLSLRRGGPDGQEVCRLVKGGSFSSSFEIIWPAGFSTNCIRQGTFNMRYEFVDTTTGEWYTWKQDSWLTSLYDWSLWKKSEADAKVPKERRTLVAHWRTPSFSISKDGTLQINPNYAHLTELILATALGVEANDGEPPSYHADPLATVSNVGASTSTATSSNSPDLTSFAEYHVYKGKQLLGRDNIVTGPDKQVVLYYLHFPNKLLSRKWDMSLRRGGPDGEEVCKIVKRGNWTSSFEIIWPAGFVTEVQQTATFQLRYDFVDRVTGVSYSWRPDSLLKRDYDFSLWKTQDVLVDVPKDRRTLVAHWSSPVFSLTKDGTLRINTDYARLSELVLATALGLEGQSTSFHAS